MSDHRREEIENVELSCFEAELAALRPQTGRLDGAWRDMLAEQTTRTPDGRSCSNPSGHRFVCIYCGRPMPTGSLRRWGWPVVAAATASIATMLLVMLTAGNREPANQTTAAANQRIATESEVEPVETTAEQPIPAAIEPWTIDFDAGILTAAGTVSSQDAACQCAMAANNTTRSSAIKYPPEKPLNNVELMRNMIQRMNE